MGLRSFFAQMHRICVPIYNVRFSYYLKWEVVKKISDFKLTTRRISDTAQNRVIDVFDDFVDRFLWQVDPDQVQRLSTVLKITDKL